MRRPNLLQPTPHVVAGDPLHRPAVPLEHVRADLCAPVDHIVHGLRVEQLGRVCQVDDHDGGEPPGARRRSRVDLLRRAAIQGSDGWIQRAAFLVVVAIAMRSMGDYMFFTTGGAPGRLHTLLWMVWGVIGAPSTPFSCRNCENGTGVSAAPTVVVGVDDHTAR